MPYKGGNRLPSECASKLGHLDVIKSELVNEIINKFESSEAQEIESKITWDPFEENKEPLRLIFSVDGSKQTVRSDLPPYKEVSFVKTALLRLDQHAISKLDPSSPHPLALKDIMTDAAIYHATVFPLKGISLMGKNNYHAVRKIIYDSLCDSSLNAEPFKTLKWIAYEKWNNNKTKSPSFECPHCEKIIEGLDFDVDQQDCEHCKETVFLSDMIGFHLEMGEDAVPDSVSTAYMLIHETLLLFTGIRYFWEANKFHILKSALFIKDGPLTLRGQYSKLAIPIRNFFQYVKDKNIEIFVMGQEKTGAFVDHLSIITKSVPNKSIFIPSNEYIRKEIQHRPERAEAYGRRTNYGNKIFVKNDEYHHIVLSVPTGQYVDSKSQQDFIGLKKILPTLETILSHRHECGLVPIELANGVASLSSYPSATVLKIFAEI